LRKEKREKKGRGADGWSRDVPSKLKSTSKGGVRVTNDMWKTFLFGHPVLHSLKPPCLARTWREICLQRPKAYSLDDGCKRIVVLTGSSFSAKEHTKNSNPTQQPSPHHGPPLDVQQCPPTAPYHRTVPNEPTLHEMIVHEVASVPGLPRALPSPS
jgi:hypothetical protein